MLTVDKLSRTPIYEQVIAQVETLILADVVREGEALPSVRALSAQLGVNPNTLQKAYTDLERRQICSSVPGSGRYVAPGAKALLQARARANLLPLQELVRELLAAGVSREELHAAIDSVHRRDEDA